MMDVQPENPALAKIQSMAQVQVKHKQTPMSLEQELEAGMDFGDDMMAASRGSAEDLMKGGVDDLEEIEMESMGVGDLLDLEKESEGMDPQVVKTKMIME